MKSDFFTQTGIFFLRIIARFPFWLIYLLSDFFYFIVYYIVAYRKKVVVQNLQNAFPAKSEKEIALLTKRYFRHLSDLILESVKMHQMTPRDFAKRMEVKNIDLVNEFYDKGKSIVLFTMHYNNWEWSGCLPLLSKHTMLGIYKPLHNKKFDAFTNEARLKMGTELVQNSQTLRRILKAEKSGEKVLSWLAGDQTPHATQKNWYMFLNQETLFYPGPAFISKKFNHPVFFQRTIKKGRGMYETYLELLFENPAELSEKEITLRYIQRMEEVINENPEYYLWSHRRWKHKRSEDIPLNK